MTIQWLETLYLCQCHCGYTFHVEANSRSGSESLPPYLVPTMCPQCHAKAYISDPQDPHPKRRHRRPPDQRRRYHRARPLFEDHDHMSQQLQNQKQLLDMHFAHWINLRQLLRQAISFWEKQYNRTLMPSFFQTMERMLHEQETEVQQTLPPNRKEL